MSYQWKDTEKENGHSWGVFNDDAFESCHECGIVRRRDKKNSPCKGKQKLRPFETIQAATACILALLLCSCTQWEDGHGARFFTMGDATNLTVNAQGFHADTLTHSVLYDASGRMIGNISSGLASILLANGVAVAVRHGATNGVQLLGAVPAMTHPMMNKRPHTPAPAPKP